MIKLTSTGKDWPLGRSWVGTSSDVRPRPGMFYGAAQVDEIVPGLRNDYTLGATDIPLGSTFEDERGVEFWDGLNWVPRGEGSRTLELLSNILATGAEALIELRRLRFFAETLAKESLEQAGID